MDEDNLPAGIPRDILNAATPSNSQENPSPVPPPDPRLEEALLKTEEANRDTLAPFDSDAWRLLAEYKAEQRKAVIDRITPPSLRTLQEAIDQQEERLRDAPGKHAIKTLLAAAGLPESHPSKRQVDIIAEIPDEVLQATDPNILAKATAYLEHSIADSYKTPPYEEVLEGIEDYSRQLARFSGILARVATGKEASLLSGGGATAAKQGAGALLRGITDGTINGKPIPASAGALGAQYNALNVVDRGSSTAIKSAAALSLAGAAVANAKDGDTAAAIGNGAAAAGIAALHPAASRQWILEKLGYVVPEALSQAVKMSRPVVTIANNAPIIGGFVTAGIVSTEVAAAYINGDEDRAEALRKAGNAETLGAFLAGGLGANALREFAIWSLRLGDKGVRHSDAVEAGSGAWKHISPIVASLNEQEAPYHGLSYDPRSTTQLEGWDR